MPLSRVHGSQPEDDELDRWVAETVRPALAYAITLVRNRHDAEDLVQDCYRRLLARAIHYDLPRDGKKLLFKSITNACINHVQRHSSKIRFELREEDHGPGNLPPGESPDAQLMQQELKQAIGQALSELPVNQRAVVELTSQGYSLADVAEMLGLSHSNTRVLLYRARQTLGARLRLY